MQMNNDGTAEIVNNGVTLSYRLEYSSDLITWSGLIGGAPVTYDPVAGEVGGTITVQSHPGRETCFDISIPLVRPEASSSSDQNNSV